MSNFSPESKRESASDGALIPGGVDSINENDGGNNNDGCVQVAVRVRPMLSKEAGHTECIEVLCDSSKRQSQNASFTNVLQLGGSSGPDWDCVGYGIKVFVLSAACL